MDVQDTQDNIGMYMELTHAVIKCAFDVINELGLKATDIEVGLLINFGSPELEFKRFTRRKNS